MKVKIKDHELELHYGNRLYIIYENVLHNIEQETGQTEIDPNSVTAQTTLLYAALQATIEYNKIDETLTALDVDMVIDENGGRSFLLRFGNWFTKKVNAEAELIRKAAEEIEKENAPAKKK